MQRINYPDMAQRADLVREQYERTPLNIIHMLAHASPAVFDGFNHFAGSFYTSSSLPAGWREIAILRAGHIAGASYEVTHHESVARGIGLSETQITAIRAGGSHPDVLDPAMQAVLDFADDFIVNARASDETLAAVRDHLTDEQLMDLMLVTGCYMMVSRILETTGIPFDNAPLNAEQMQATAKNLGA